jgi:hypothetical protein
MLRATRREIEKAYRNHRDQSGDCSTLSLRLLLIYSVECGLKAMLMRAHRVETYDQLPVASQIQHDIASGLKQLSAPPNLLLRSVSTRHQKPPQESVHTSKLHQTFRYGIPIDDDAQVTGELRSILTWLNERLR